MLLIKWISAWARVLTSSDKPAFNSSPVGGLIKRLYRGIAICTILPLRLEDGIENDARGVHGILVLCGKNGSRVV